jgi:hypothetical protein
MMDDQLRLIGSAWFTSGEGREMADLVEAGLLSLGAREHDVSSLEGVNEAIGGIAQRNGGFGSFSISPLGTSWPRSEPDFPTSAFIEDSRHTQYAGGPPARSSTSARAPSLPFTPAPVTTAVLLEAA